MHRTDMRKPKPDQTPETPAEEPAAPAMFYKPKPQRTEVRRAAAFPEATPRRAANSNRMAELAGNVWLGALMAETVWLAVLVLLWLPVTRGAAGLELDIDAAIRLFALGVLGTVVIFAGAAFVGAARRSDRASAHLARVSQRLTEPVGAAANEVVGLGTAVRQEIESLNNSLEGALKRVGMLEAIVREKAAQIDHSTATLEKRVGRLDELLGSERTKIEAMARDLDANVLKLVERIEARTRAVTEANARAEASFKKSETATAEQTRLLTAASEEALRAAKQAETVLRTQREELVKAGAGTLERAEAIAQRYREQTEALEAMSARFDTEQTKMRAVIEDQRSLATDLASSIESQAQRIDDTLRRTLSELMETSTQLAERTAASGTVFSERMAAVRKEGSVSTEALVVA
ncbi:MAG: hypothetical protein HXY25_13410, partial [Alphaproteobacteria bacterium]|nr:hypothetical protein [Alphaproteobacteria bacterium]